MSKPDGEIINRAALRRLIQTEAVGVRRVESAVFAAVDAAARQEVQRIIGRRVRSKRTLVL